MRTKTVHKPNTMDDIVASFFLSRGFGPLSGGGLSKAIHNEYNIAESSLLQEIFKIDHLFRLRYHLAGGFRTDFRVIIKYTAHETGLIEPIFFLMNRAQASPRVA